MAKGNGLHGYVAEGCMVVGCIAARCMATVRVAGCGLLALPLVPEALAAGFPDHLSRHWDEDNGVAWALGTGLLTVVATVTEVLMGIVLGADFLV